MRTLLIVIGLVCVAIPSRGFAAAKPKIAVAPIAGDDDDKIAKAVAEAAAKDFTVVSPKTTGRELTRLGITDELDAKAVRKLAKKLGVVAVIGGKVEKDGGKRSLHLEIHRRGQPDTGFTIEFKSPNAAFRKAVRKEIAKKLEGAGDDPAGDDEAATPFADTGARSRSGGDDRPARKADDERPARKADDEAARKADDEAARKPSEDDDARRTGRARRVATTDDEDAAAVRKRKRKARAEQDSQAPSMLARVGGGGSVAQRSLSYATRAGFTQTPPGVLTTAGAGRIDGELYPFAIADAASSLAPLGIALAYDKTFGLAIKIPNQTVSAPINQSHYMIGARYRFAIGSESSATVGLDYARRQYIADRTGLGTVVLDTPDVDYAMIAPGGGLRLPIAGSVTGFAAASVLLVLGTGAITTNANYGAASAYGVDATGGVDIAIAQQVGLRIGAEFSQIMLTFNANAATATKANNRDNNPATQDITGATDRWIGLAVTLGLTY